MIVFARSPVEQLTYLGYKWKPKSDDPSVLFFTVHKCASTYMNKFFKYLNKKNMNLTSLNMEGFLFHAGNHDITPYLQKHSAEIFRPKGFCYAPLRDYLQIGNVRDYRVVVMVRDPRDVLVSLYFSHAFSHGMPLNKAREKTMLAVRKRALDSGLNEQVLQYLPVFRDRYLNYYRYLVEEAGASLLFYENMVGDFDSWLDRMQKALALDINPEDAAELKRIGKFGQVSGENKYSHVRKVTPGDYKEKLTPEFIDHINELLKEVLDLYHYQE